MKTDTAYIIVYDWMSQAVGYRECVLFALLYSFADEHGSVQISRGYIAHRLSCSKDAVQYNLDKLIQAGHIRLDKEGRGKGNATTYTILTKRGEKYPLMNTPKGGKNTPLSEIKRGEKYPLKKGGNLPPNNNNLLNNSPALQESNTHTHEGMEDYGFSTFWELFKPAAEFTNLRRACCQAWAEATEPQREQMLAELRRGEPHRQNPLYHIRYFGENRASADAPELLTMQQVYARFNTTEPKGWCVLALEFEAPDKARWCKIEDAERKGYPIRRKWA